MSESTKPEMSPLTAMFIHTSHVAAFRKLADPSVKAGPLDGAPIFEFTDFPDVALMGRQRGTIAIIYADGQGVRIDLDKMREPPELPPMFGFREPSMGIGRGTFL